MDDVIDLTWIGEPRFIPKIGLVNTNETFRVDNKRGKSFIKQGLAIDEIRFLSKEDKDA